MTTVPISLRQWKDQDLEPYAAMNADVKVMKYFPKPLTVAESKESLLQLRAGIDQRGWGLWAVEVDGAFAGFTGLAEPKFSAHFIPCVEIGWRFRREFWGRSIAYSAALVAQSFAFQKLNVSELVSFTSAINARSRRLMERLGFTRNESDDFLHPSLAEDSPLRLHVLYRKPNKSGRREDCPPGFHVTVDAGPRLAVSDACSLRADGPRAAPTLPVGPGFKPPVGALYVLRRAASSAHEQ